MGSDVSGFRWNPHYLAVFIRRWEFPALRRPGGNHGSSGVDSDPVPMTPLAGSASNRFNGRLRAKLCHFSRPGADPGAAPSTALGAGGRQNGRVANELCPTKRRTNTDELARIT